MNLIIEIDRDGTISLPTEILKAIAPNKRFIIEIQNKTLILHPESTSLPFWATATPQERAERLLKWSITHQEGANLSDEALSRENIYD